MEALTTGLIEGPTCVSGEQNQRYFVSETGQKYDFIDGLRERIIPNWPRYYLPPSEAGKNALTQNEINKNIQGMKQNTQFLQAHGFSFQNKDVFEFGCGYGVRTYLMSELGARSVTGMDFPDYSIRQSNEMDMTHSNKEMVSGWTTCYREQVGQLFPPQTRTRVDFIEGDIHQFDVCEKYDAIMSWYTLEHIHNPMVALENVYRALKPGGFSFHEYNPFFSFSGGHPFCTLDFPFGHCCLSPQDFRRYILQFRPREQKAALDYYENNLNRMTYADLVHCADKAGFQILAFIPWANQNRVSQIDQAILMNVQRNYPKATMADLMADIVWILLRKPA